MSMIWYGPERIFVHTKGHQITTFYFKLPMLRGILFLWLYLLYTSSIILLSFTSKSSNDHNSSLHVMIILNWYRIFLYENVIMWRWFDIIWRMILVLFTLQENLIFLTLKFEYVLVYVVLISHKNLEIDSFKFEICDSGVSDEYTYMLLL